MIAQSILQETISKIEELNPLHAKKLKADLNGYDEAYFQKAEIFLQNYLAYLSRQNKDLDYAVDCYLRMIADITYEYLRFLETGHYSCASFQEAQKNVYDNAEVMEYYMNALILSQFLWGHHYEMLSFFTQGVSKHKGEIKKYLEIGCGHGLFISEALNILNPDIQFDVVDISPTSIEMAKNFIKDPKVSFLIKDIFAFEATEKYDFIAMGEVLEHVEEPLKLLQKLRSLLTNKGCVYLSVPVNIPAIDHIYVFRSAQEIRDALLKAGFTISEEITIHVEDVSKHKDEELKTSLMYGAFLQPQKE